jgi:hypothetical protein
MPIQIDRMDTSVEILPATPGAPASGERRTGASPEPAGQGALADAIGKLMAAELDRFLRGRGS